MKTIIVDLAIVISHFIMIEKRIEQKRATSIGTKVEHVTQIYKLVEIKSC